MFYIDEYINEIKQQIENEDKLYAYEIKKKLLIRINYYIFLIMEILNRIIKI